MNISEKGQSLIKSFEGLKLSSYQCSANVWTIGYGHTLNVKRGDIITIEQADCYLMQDLQTTENQINKLVHVPLTQNQYDALCALVFNIGTGAFSTSTLLKKLNKCDYLSASEQFKVWNKVTRNGVKVVESGLVRRRQAEEDLFNAK